MIGAPAHRDIESIGRDGRIGRRSPPLFAPRGYRDIAVDYVIVDTERVPRATFSPEPFARSQRSPRDSPSSLRLNGVKRVRSS
jgi:hypothetical protein